MREVTIIQDGLGIGINERLSDEENREVTRKMMKILDLILEVDTKPAIVAENMRAQIRALAKELRA